MFAQGLDSRTKTGVDKKSESWLSFSYSLPHNSFILFVRVYLTAIHVL